MHRAEDARITISIIVPARDEERFLGATLQSIARAKEFLLTRSGAAAEVIVTDNDSADATASIALSLGAQVVKEPQRNIARARNAGAAVARGEVLVFVDADTLVPEQLLWRIAQEMEDENCLGGAVDTAYRPARLTMKAYLTLWRVLGRLTGMAQGATQFCRREAHALLGGYDESLFMGEDVDFHWRLKRLARRQRARTSFIEDVQVIPSTRRFDQWSLWRTLVRTNPLFILLLRRRQRAWQGWYDTAPR